MASRGSSSRSKSRSKGKSASPAAKSPFNFVEGTRMDEYVLPFVLTLVLIPLGGFLCHVFLGPSWGWQVTNVSLATMVGFGLILSAFTWAEATSRDRSPFPKSRATATVAWMFAAPAVTTVFGWSSGAWLRWLFGVGVALGIAWCIPKTEAVRGREGEVSDKKDSFAEKLGLPGHTTAKVLKEDRNRRVVEVDHRGVESDVLQKNAGLIEAEGLPVGAVTAVAGALGGFTRITIMLRDVLKKPEPWDGPSHPGGSIALPLWLGRYEDDADLMLSRPGEHFLITGMTGSAKTQGGWVTQVAEMCTRHDVVIWLSDTAKSMQSAMNILPAIDWLARTAAETKQMLSALQAAIDHRSTWLGQRGFHEWVEGCGIPLLVAHFEEAAAVVSELGEELTRLVEQARSVGISISISLQRASHTNLLTDVRSQLTNALCFGVREDVDAGMALSDETLAAGAKPWLWKNKKPGYVYAEVGDPDRWTSKARTFWHKPKYLDALMAEWAPRMASLDPGTAEVASRVAPAYEKYRRPIRIPHVAPEAAPPTPEPRPVPAAAVPERPMARAMAMAGTGTEQPPAPEWFRIPERTPGAMAVPFPGSPFPPSYGTTPAVPQGYGPEPEDEEEWVDPQDQADEDLSALEYQDQLHEAADELADDEDQEEQDLISYAGNPRDPEPDYPEGEDVELGAGTPGPPRSSAEWDEEFRKMIDNFLGDQSDVDVTTAAMLEKWLDLPGMTPAQRPALTRRVRALVERGLASDRGRGRWRLHAGAGDNALSVAESDTEGDDE